ncbi:MAG: phosphoglycerate mutase [Xanthomonadaceae bacterium]|nr:phosphoglycerate mutase [Xanthomonadaceae bacterium]
MARLTLLLPPQAKFAGIALPATLGKAVARADRTQAAAGEQAQMLRHFVLLPRAMPDQLPEAALSRLADAGMAGTQGAQWLRADPAHIRPDINGARLLGLGRTVGIEQADVDALLPALRPLFGDLGMALDAPHPERWYVRLEAGASLPEFAAPEAALGDDVFEHIPDGPQARRWRVLMNEVQVALHNHPHNQARLASGRVPINALWFWGGGRLPDAVQADVPTLHSGDPVLQGAAQLGKLTCMPLTTFDAVQAPSLVDLRGQRDVRALIERWLLPALRAGATFDFADGHVFTLRPAQRWRVWRKSLQRLPA